MKQLSGMINDNKAPLHIYIERGCLHKVRYLRNLANQLH